MSSSFETTQWDLVLAASIDGAPGHREALERLCRVYWMPIKSYLARTGKVSEDASDLTQEFFAHLLSRDLLAKAQPCKGKFRSFLLTAVKHYVADLWDKNCALKRGGGQTPIPLDQVDTEDITDANAASSANGGISSDIDYIFDHAWAVTLLERAMKSLEDSYENGNAPMFNELKPFLSRVGNTEAYALAARKLHMSVGAVMVAIHRLRRRYRDAVRREVAYTVDSPAGIDAEMRYLIQVIQGGKQVEETVNGPA